MVVGAIAHYRPYGGQPNSGVIKAVVPFMSAAGDQVDFFELDNGERVLSTECFIERAEEVV